MISDDNDNDIISLQDPRRGSPLLFHSLDLAEGLQEAQFVVGISLSGTHIVRLTATCFYVNLATLWFPAGSGKAFRGADWNAGVGESFSMKYTHMWMIFEEQH